MLDVASLAQVSLKTVSRVVNGEPGVAPERAQRVRTAALELGYRHNLGASNLRRGSQTAAIGLLVQDLSNDFCGVLLRAVEDRARERGVVVMSASLDDEPERERDLVAGLVSRRSDGLILMPSTSDQSYLKAEVEAGLNVVVVDRRPTTPLDSVTVDNAGGAASAADHLLRHGHRRIGGLFDDLRITTAPERLAGFMDSMARGSVAPDTHLRRDRAAHGGRRHRRRPCHARAPGSTHRVLLRSQRPHHGRRPRPPAGGARDEVAVVGFDDFSGADLLQPRVTVGQDGCSRVRPPDLCGPDGRADRPTSFVLPTELIVRGSGEIRGPYGVPP